MATEPHKISIKFVCKLKERFVSIHLYCNFNQFCIFAHTLYFHLAQCNMGGQPFWAQPCILYIPAIMLMQNNQQSIWKCSAAFALIAQHVALTLVFISHCVHRVKNDWPTFTGALVIKHLHWIVNPKSIFFMKWNNLLLINKSVNNCSYFTVQREWIYSASPLIFTTKHILFHFFTYFYLVQFCCNKCVLLHFVFWLHNYSA